MTTTKNNEHKKLNFSSEREQSQACLNSAEHEKNQGRKVLNVPNLRFKEFQGEWEYFLINDVCSEFKSGKNIKADSVFECGEYPVYGGNGLRGYTSSYNHDGSYVLIGRQGALCGNVRSVYGKTYITEHAIAVAGNEKSNTNFLHYLFLKMNLGQYSDQSAQPGLAVNKLLKLKVALPIISEQTKIAKLLSLLDERIATQNKIIDKLQSLIKGLRVRLIQIENGNIVHLGEIARIYQPQTISSTELTEDGFLVYGANGIIGKYKEYNHKTEQICITCRGNTCGMVNYTKPMSWITGNAMVINTDEHQNKVCKRYLYHYLSAYNFNSIISGSGQPQIVRTPLENLEITLPSIFEQEQKAMLLDRIQAKIEISNRVLSLCQEQKQYLLRQMFI